MIKSSFRHPLKRAYLYSWSMKPQGTLSMFTTYLEFIGGIIHYTVDYNIGGIIHYTVDL